MFVIYLIILVLRCYGGMPNCMDHAVQSSRVRFIQFDDVNDALVQTADELVPAAAAACDARQSNGELWLILGALEF